MHKLIYSNQAQIDLDDAISNDLANYTNKFNKDKINE